MKVDRLADETSAAASPKPAVLGTNQRGVGDHNERLVLTLIREHGPLAKAEIARISGLSAQTVSVIMRRLEGEGLLKKGEPVRGKVGQPSVPMGLDANGAFFLGLKVGRRSLDLVLCNFLGQVVGRVYVTHKFPTPDGVIAFARDAVEQLVAGLPKDRQGRVAGLGVAMPFQLWDWAKALDVDPADMADWRRRDVGAELGEATGLNVYVRNDATAACGAELVFGEPDRPRDFLYFFIGFFIGGGIVLDNTLMTGRTGNAAALGPMPVAPDGPGLRHLMDVASLNLLEKALAERGLSGDAIWDDPAEWDVPDDLLNEWIDRAVDGLAHAAFSACCVLDFDHILIDGWTPAAVKATIVERLEARLAAYDWAGLEKPKARAGSVGSDARALGAASLPLSETYLVKRNGYLKAYTS